MTISFSRYSLRTLNTSGFSELPADIQHIIYHLSLAGSACRNIVYSQFGLYGKAVRDVLLDIIYRAPLTEHELSLVKQDLLTVLACNGIYHDTQGDRIQPSFSQDDFSRWCESTRTETNHELQQMAMKGLFSPDIPSTLTDAFVWQSGGVTAEVRGEELDALRRLETNPNAPLHGINLLLHKCSDGSIEHKRYAIGQLFSKELQHSCKHLYRAMDFAVRYPALQESIRTLIRFYQTGRPEDFDAHCLAWVRNQDCPVYFSQGFIECLEDPAKRIGSYQSLVGFKDPKISAQMDKIIALSQYIEDNLPVDPAYRRTQAVGVLGSATRLVSMHGAPAPVLPLGCVLPNNNWIRETVGCYSTLFVNVAEQRGILSDDVLPRFIAPSHIPTLKQHLAAGFSAMVSLHECAGHASGRMLDGVSLYDLGNVYNIIEECRADLVAYYFLGCPDFAAQILPEVTDHDAFAKAMYAEYLSQGTLHQLFRLPLNASNYGAATHFRSRQLNNAYVLERALLSGAVRMTKTDHGLCIEVVDAQVVRALYGTLLAEIQRIKSTGDKQSAAELVERYGTHIKPEASADAHRRVEDLQLKSYTAFLRPVFTKTGDPTSPYKLEQPTDPIAGLL